MQSYTATVDSFIRVPRCCPLSKFIRIFVLLYVKPSSSCINVKNVEHERKVYEASKLKRNSHCYSFPSMFDNGPLSVFKNVPCPAFFCFFSVFFKRTIFTTIYCENMSIWCCESYPLPLEHKPPPITTRPGLLV